MLTRGRVPPKPKEFFLKKSHTLGDCSGVGDWDVDSQCLWLQVNGGSLNPLGKQGGVELEALLVERDGLGRSCWTSTEVGGGRLGQWAPPPHLSLLVRLPLHFQAPEPGSGGVYWQTPARISRGYQAATMLFPARSWGTRCPGSANSRH